MSIISNYLLKVSSKHRLFAPAFTIVELLIVIVIIGVLAAITIVSFTGITKRATIASLQSDLNNASKQLSLDQAVNNAYPATLASANNNRGIRASANTSLQYFVKNDISPQEFCITASKNSIKYKISNNSSPMIGDCLGDGLILNLDAGNTNSYPGSGTT